MIRLLVFSDTHLDTRRMEYAVNQVSPDIIVHLSDTIGDAAKIREKVPYMPFHMVKGNGDIQIAGELEKFITIENVKVFLTHGHKYHVKEGLFYLIRRARELGADLVLFGHTHGAAIVKGEGMTLMNPGQMQFHQERRRASYGIVTIDDGRFECEIVYLPGDLYDEFY